MSTRGKPFEKGNKFGKGRPKGSRNKGILVSGSVRSQELLLEHGEEIIEKAIDLAKEGHPVARKLCVERLVPRLKEVAQLPAEPPREPAVPTIRFFDHDGNRLRKYEKDGDGRRIPERAR